MNPFANWSERTLGSRLTLIGSALAIVALLGAGFVWLSSEEYDVLFTDLEPRDAAGIVSELQRLKVGYRLEHAGRQILVPRSSVHEVRLQLMGSGVALSGTVGFEIFDESDFGVTEFAQRINYQRALEGELTRTVASLDEVKYARVHLVIPERGLFRQKDEPPSASITLFLENGARPDNRHVLGIQRLVAAAVPGLAAEQVTVSDQDGLTLSTNVSASAGIAAASGRLQQKQAVEQYLTDKVNGVLEGAFGPGQAMVSVDVELDLDEVRTTNETVVPAADANGGVLRRRETRSGPASPGNTPTGNVTTEVEYQLGRSVEQIIGTPGRILRLNVGVMLPADVTEARTAAARELVAAAVGLEQERGDVLSVHAMRLTSNPVPEAALPGDGPVLREWVTEPPLPTGTGSPENTSQGLDRFAASVGGGARRALLVAGLVSLALVLSIVRVFQLRSLARNATPPLSDADRTRALNDLKRWLAKADEPPQAEGQNA